MPKFIKYLLPGVVLMFLIQTGKAQLCTGSLGDPVVNINFGTGNNPGPPLPASTTSYNYVSIACPNDGNYTITSSSQGCFSNTWHSLSEDHTPDDVNGYMMLVNASLSPGVFYLDTVKNLCGGTTYEFSAWLMSVLKNSACSGNGNMPNITFSIETVTGTVIQTYSTGNISNLPFPQWNQYGFFFTLPPAYGDLVLRMINNAPGGCGNDLALDDIAFRPCGPKLGAAFANVNGINDTVNYCITDNKNIKINGDIQAGYNNPAFQWQQSTDSGKTWTDIPGATGTSYTKTYSVAGRFQFRMTAAESGNIGIIKCRVASNVLTINIDAIPVPQASNSSPVCVNLPVTLSAKNGDTYQWNGPNAYTSNVAVPVIAAATLSNNGKYYVLVSTRGGCSKLDSTMVIVSGLPPADAGRDTTICESSSTVLQASGGTVYRWEAAASLSDTTVANPTARPVTTTAYVVTVRNQFFCWSKDTVLVKVLKKPVANAGPDKKISEGQSILLDGVASGDTAAYFWTPAQFISNSNILTPLVTPPGDITYTFHVLSGNGCGAATDEAFVRVYKKIVIPNAFSPNADGINDVWNIEALETYPEAVVQVFNRYGQVVFRSQGYSKPWDGSFNGKPLPVGTYYYSIDRKNSFPVMSGWIMLIR
ncbi:MAG: gliding motility-associated C-terminal domain-containing protein [Chitinophagaceae bacterium]